MIFIYLTAGLFSYVFFRIKHKGLIKVLDVLIIFPYIVFMWPLAFIIYIGYKKGWLDD